MESFINLCSAYDIGGGSNGTVILLSLMYLVGFLLLFLLLLEVFSTATEKGVPSLLGMLLVLVYWFGYLHHVLFLHIFVSCL